MCGVALVCDAPVDHLFRGLAADRAGIAEMLLLERHAAGGHAALLLHLQLALQLAAPHRLDELPQIFNVLSGSMSIVGTRPEVQHYVDMYKPEYLATLLMPAGITSLASIMYKDEEKLLKGEIDVDRVYVEKILPEKMKFNLSYVKNFSFGSDIKLMFKTVKEVFS